MLDEAHFPSGLHPFIVARFLGEFSDGLCPPVLLFCMIDTRKPNKTLPAELDCQGGSAVLPSMSFQEFTIALNYWKLIGTEWLSRLYSSRFQWVANMR